jgi:hypothetical protein
MAGFRDFEIEAIRILAAGALTPAAIESILQADALSRYEYTGSGYFATVAVSLDVAETQVFATPFVMGTLGGSTCSFVIFVRPDEVTLECAPCDGDDPPEGFRDGAVVLSVSPINSVDLTGYAT